MEVRYLKFVCTRETFRGCCGAAMERFDAMADYEILTKLYDACPECESFPREEYFSGDWYENWEDYVILDGGRIAARAGIWKISAEEWEVAGVITHPEYRGKGYAASVVGHCTARILDQGKTAVLYTAETNTAMIAAAKKAGFVVRK